MKKILMKIHDFFVFWFWWRWRSAWLNKQTDKDREFFFKEYTKTYKEMKTYTYIGFGSILKHYRDGTLLMQDIDIIIDSREFFKKQTQEFVKKLNLKLWSVIRLDDKIVEVKYLLNNRTPIEFFLVDVDKNEKSYVIHDSKYPQMITIPKQKTTIVNTDYGKTIMIENMEEYVEGIYGKGWKTPIKTSKYDPNKHANKKSYTNLTGKCEVNYSDKL